MDDEEAWGVLVAGLIFIVTFLYMATGRAVEYKKEKFDKRDW